MPCCSWDLWAQRRQAEEGAGSRSPSSHSCRDPRAGGGGFLRLRGGARDAQGYGAGRHLSQEPTHLPLSPALRSATFCHHPMLFVAMCLRHVVSHVAWPGHGPRSLLCPGLCPLH